MKCVFCAIVEGSLPASRVAESARSVAFVDLRQPHGVERGAHVLVVPRRHVETLDRLADDDAADLAQLAVRVARRIRALFGDEGLSLWQSNGVAAFQEVPHVHLHLLTRRIDDGLLRVYPGHPGNAPRDALEALAARLREDT